MNIQPIIQRLVREAPRWAQAKRPLMAIVSVCPECGLHAEFVGTFFGVSTLVPVPVKCRCGWSGETPRAVAR